MSEICHALPESREELAWVGVRWRIRRETYAHVLMVDGGWPPAYAAASGLQGPACLLTFRTGERLFQPERYDGPPFFRPRWFPNIMGRVLDEPVDWDEVAGLVRESYCVLAPRKLAAAVRSWP